MNKICYLVVILLAFQINKSLANWQKELVELISGNAHPNIDSAINKIIDEKPSYKDIISVIKNAEYSKKQFGAFEKNIKCLDGIKRPYVTYVPEKYDPRTPTPLIIYLHGAVSREQIRPGRVAYALRKPFRKLADKRGWILVYPFGQKTATWWNRVGMNNILNIIRQTKKEYNIDDDRVYMTGFSDGGSGSFLFSMTYPTDFAAFIPLNGHMGVGPIVGKINAYPANMKNSPLYVINTDLDSLYPATEMRKTVDLAIKAGADIFYKEYNGIGHRFDYADKEMPLFEKFMERNPRNPIPSEIEWKTADPRFGKCRWFKINKTKKEDPKPWHVDYNLELENRRGQTYYLFPRNKPSTAAVVNFRSNTFNVKESRLGGFSIMLHPDMIQLDQNVVVRVNNKIVFNKKVDVDLKFMIKNYLLNRDRKLLYINKITIDSY